MNDGSEESLARGLAQAARGEAVPRDDLLTDTGPSLTEFLLARIAEDEQDARSWLAPDAAPDEARPVLTAMGERMLAECEAKRRIVEQLQRHERLVEANSGAHVEASRGGIANQEQIAALRTHGWELKGRLEALRMAVDSHAAVYADHPDFRPEWRP